MSTRRILVAAMALLTASSMAHAAAPLADRLPADTLVYVGWAGLKSPPPLLEKLLGAPGAPGPALKAILDTAPPDRRPLIEHAVAIGQIALKRPAAIALLDLRKGKDGGEPLPSAALLIDLGEQRAAFAEHLEAILKAAGEELPLQETAVGDFKFRAMPTPAGPLAFGFIKDTFLLAIGEGAPKALIEQDPAKALARQELFAKAISQVAGPEAVLCGFVNAAALNERLAPLFDAEMAKQGQSLRFRPLLEALGLGGTQAVAAGLNPVDRGLHFKMRILSPAPHRGLLMPFAGRPLTDQDLADVPADADVLAAANLSAADLLKELLRVVKAIDAAKGAELEQNVRQAVLPGGVSVVDDLIGSLGDTWVLSSARSQGGLITGTLLSVTVKDQARLKAALGRIEQALPAGRAEAPAPADDGPLGPPRSAPPAIRTLVRGDLEVHYLSVKGLGPFMVLAPAWAIHNGRLYVAAWPQVIESAVQNAGADPLVKSPAFLRSRQGLSGNPSVLLYANTPKLLAEAYPLMLLGWSAACNFGELPAGLELSMDWLPPLSQILRDVQPEIAAVSADAEGISFESRSTLPSLAAMPAMTAMGVSILIPGLSRARFLARKASSGANLSNIGKHVAIYGASHKDQYPPDLAALLADGAPATIFVSPLSERSPPKLVGGKLVGEVDYIYIPLPANAPAELILAYERPENYRGEGTMVLFADTHIEQVDMARFQKLLKETQDWLKANRN